MLTDDRSFVVESGIPAERDGELIVPLAVQYPKDSDWAERLFAVLKSGKRQQASTRLSKRIINGVGITSFVFWRELAVKADDVDRYDLEVLPRTNLVLRNLPAAPGGDIKPNIEVLPPHAWPKFKG